MSKEEPVNEPVDEREVIVDLLVNYTDMRADRDGVEHDFDDALADLREQGLMIVRRDAAGPLVEAFGFVRQAREQRATKMGDPSDALDTLLDMAEKALARGLGEAGNVD